MAGEMAGGHFLGGSEMAEKWPGKWLDSQILADFWPSSHLSSHFSAISEPPRKMAAGHFAGHISGHFWFWARFPFFEEDQKGYPQKGYP